MHVRSGIVIWKDSLVTRTRVFPLRYLSMGSSDLVPNWIYYRVSRRMDQRKHKGHLLKLCYWMVQPSLTCLSLEPPRHFKSYSETVFLPYVTNLLRNVERVDVVWDRYLPGSLKILHKAREERVSVDTSDRRPGSQEIGQPS